MRTLLVVATVVAATVALGKANHASACVTAQQSMFVDGSGPEEPLPVPIPKRA